MKIVNREEFTDIIRRSWARANEITPADDPINEDSPLWFPESMDKKNIWKSNWFVCVNPISLWNLKEAKKEYWEWSRTQLTGRIACYTSSDWTGEEWWGFENKDDIVLWSLRWL